MKDLVFISILGITWFIGLFGSFVMAYFIAYQENRKNSNNVDFKKYTYSDLIDIQDNLGGPLVLIPFLNIILLIYTIIVYFLSKKDIKFWKFMNKEI